MSKKTEMEIACELVAFGSGAEAPFTVRRGLAAMAENEVLVRECPEVFGMSFEELRAGLLELADLDREYESENLFD